VVSATIPTAVNLDFLGPAYRPSRIFKYLDSTECVRYEIQVFWIDRYIYSMTLTLIAKDGVAIGNPIYF
jgi:hypothetical protein